MGTQFAHPVSGRLNTQPGRRCRRRDARVPDGELDESVKAVVQLVDPASCTCPRGVDFTDELPRDPNGTLWTPMLGQQYWAGHDGRVI